MAAVSLAPIIIMLGLGGGFGLPLGVPPLPEDPVCARVAPAECLFYGSWAGMAKPDPQSGNQTEQLLAEPEVQELVATIERLIRANLTEQAQRGGPEGVAMVEEAVKWGKLLITRPTAIYVAEVKPPMNGPPVVRAGAVVNVNDEAGNLKAALEKYSPLLGQLNIEKVPVNGETFYRIQPAPGVSVSAGVRGKYFILAVGDGELEAMLQRARGEAPEWLTALRKQLPVERLSTVSYLNVEAIVEQFGPMAGPKLPLVLDATGLTGVKAVSSVTGLDATGFVSKVLVGTRGELKGVLALAAQQPLTADDLAAVPQDATFAFAWKLDAKKLFETIVDVAGTIDPRAKEQMLQGLGQMEEGIGISVQNDVLAALGDTWCVYDSPGGGGMFTGVTAVVRLRDAKAAATANGKLIALVKGMAPPDGDPRREPKIEQYEFAGQQVYGLQARQHDFVVAPTWCITEKELVIGLYPQTVKAFLTRRADAPSLAKAPTVAAAIEDGVLSLGYVDQRRLFDLFYPMLPVIAQAAANEMQRKGMEISPSLLPSAGAISPHLGPAVSTVRRTEAGIEVTTRQTLPGGSIGASAPMSVALLLPAVMSARESARRMQAMNSLKQIGLAMHNYHDTYKSFPAAYSVDKDGKPLLSWRVHILPYIDQGALYEQFKLDEPWDSEHNIKLVPMMPVAYRSPNSTLGPGMTNFLTVRGEGTVFPGSQGMKMASIVDGTSNTIMVVEVPDRTAVTWTKPDDYEFDKDNPAAGLSGMRPGGFNAAFCDGAVRFVADSIDGETLVALFGRADGKVVPQDFDAPQPRRTIIRSTTEPYVDEMEAGPAEPLNR